MIHTARQSPKFIKLKRRLRGLVPEGSFCDAESVAIAILERLWHATASGPIRGDIGSYDDEVIAEACGWPLEASLLIGLLVECGWLDEHPTHRLLVHDWHQHAPNHVKGNVAKKGGFLTADYQRAETDTTQAGPHGEPRRPADTASLYGEPQGTGAPNLTKPNITTEEAASASLSAEPTAPPPPDDAAEFVRLWNATEGVRPCRDFNAKRRSSLKARLKERVETDDGRLPWRDAFRLALATKFPLPCTRGDPGGWRPTPDWMLKPNNLQSIFEGKFDWSKTDGRSSESRIGAGQRFDPQTAGVSAASGDPADDGF